MTQTVELFHGTAHANHASIMRDGLKPAAHGGPYVTVTRGVAGSYALWCAQAHRAETAERDAKGIVYTLRVPPDRVRRAADVEGRRKSRFAAPGDEVELCVPDGVPSKWIVGHWLVEVPPDAARGMVRDTLAAAGHRLTKALDSGGALQRQLVGLGYSLVQAKGMAGALTSAMMDPVAIVGEMPNVALSGAVEAALAVLGGMR